MQGGDVLFEVTLPTPLSKPVKLIIEYVDLDSLFRRKNVTTNVAYNIAKTYILSASWALELAITS